MAVAGDLTARYRFDRQGFEDLYFHLTADLTPNVRFRTDYEHDTPRSPFVTFREQFTGRYALGELTLFRAELHHRPDGRWHYFFGGERATQGKGRDGWGIRFGLDHRFPFDLTVEALYDFLELSRDRAHALSVRGRYPLTSRLEWDGGFAFRAEEKRLYGRNFVRAVFGEIRYFFNRSWSLSCGLNYIANSARKDDYVAEVRLIYFLDRFHPKGRACRRCWSLSF